MRKLGAVTVILCLVAQGAWAKPRNCFTKAEISADLVVRHGVFLREAAGRCENTTHGVWKTWKEFDDGFGAKLRGERTKRENAFKREFPDNWLKAVTTFDARMVTYERNLYNTDNFCDDIKSQLDDNKKGGWSSFVKQTKNMRDMSILDIRPCD